MEIPKGDSVTSVEEYRRFFRHSLMQACLALGSECMKKSRLQEALQYFETFFTSQNRSGENGKPQLSECLEQLFTVWD